ncbi:phospholipase D-like domain-containing protein [Bacillus haynesii]|uniref:phospholipase D-like domain-containing protein n=1 Tax=Bacillus haynesii TaxID=1925021 RepID=UPI0022810B67|nr:phospholipase D-like domain-containing protein [Bacillus haynesii]MCY9223500.1 phospholipase D-like domain-containing protein [Bacillus haynesii]
MLKDYQTRLYVLAEELNIFIRNEEVYGQDLIIKEFKKTFPNIEVNDLNKIIALFKIQNKKFKKEVISAEFVATVPPPVQIKGTRRTMGVLREYILASKNTILITGYTISDFAKDFIQLLKKKASEGVTVKFFLDKHVNESIINSVVENELNFKIFKLVDSNLYSNLHAKIAVFDNKHALISSSNLSYNGIINNIEIGNLLHGEKVGELETLFEEMLERRLFKELN